MRGRFLNSNAQSPHHLEEQNDPHQDKNRRFKIHLFSHSLPSCFRNPAVCLLTAVTFIIKVTPIFYNLQATVRRSSFSFQTLEIIIQLWYTMDSNTPLRCSGKSTNGSCVFPSGQKVRRMGKNVGVDHPTFDKKALTSASCLLKYFIFLLR